MNKRKETICILPARIGSKRVKKKILNYFQGNQLFIIQLNKLKNLIYLKKSISQPIVKKYQK